MSEIAGTVDWVIRPYYDGDIPRITAALNAALAADGLDIVYSPDEMRSELSGPNFDPHKHSVLVEGPPIEGLPDGMLAGFGWVKHIDDREASERIYDVVLGTHPSTRKLGLERVIAGRLVEIARDNEQSPGKERMDTIRIRASISAKSKSLARLYESLGMEQTRQFWIMLCPLDDLEEPQPVEGISIRNYRLPEDNRASLEAYNNSFADHYGSHPSTEERWNHRLSRPSFRPDLSWVAEIEGEPGKLAGFCICAIFDEQNKSLGRRWGWVDLLGTVRGWRRKGLGRSLLLHGLRSLKSAGMDTAGLGVDSKNLTGANRLYESVGFYNYSLRLRFECDLEEVKA